MGYADSGIKKTFALAVVIAGAVIGSAGQAEAIPFAKRLPLLTAVVEHAEPPVAQLDFCRQDPADCDADPYSPREIGLTGDVVDGLLTEMNRLVATLQAKVDVAVPGAIRRPRHYVIGLRRHSIVAL